MLDRGRHLQGEYALPEKVMYDDALEALRDPFRMLDVGTPLTLSQWSEAAAVFVSGPRRVRFERMHSTALCAM